MFLKLLLILLVLLFVSTLESQVNIGVVDNGITGTAKINEADLAVSSNQFGWSENYFDMEVNLRLEILMFHFYEKFYLPQIQ